MDKGLKKKLEAALLAKGLNKELLKFISITKESEIEGAIAELEKLQGSNDEPKNLDDYLKDNTEAQSEIDRRITKAIDTFSKKHNIKPKKEDTTDGDEPDDDIPAWAKKLLGDVEAIKTGKEKDSKISKAEKAWNETKLPDSIKTKWFKRIDVDSETSVEDQIKELEAEYTELRQGVANDKGGDGLPETFDDGEATDAEIDAIVGT